MRIRNSRSNVPPCRAGRSPCSTRSPCASCALSARRTRPARPSCRGSSAPAASGSCRGRASPGCLVSTEKDEFLKILPYGGSMHAPIPRVLTPLWARGHCSARSSAVSRCRATKAGCGRSATDKAGMPGARPTTTDYWLLPLPLRTGHWSNATRAVNLVLDATRAIWGGFIMSDARYME